MKFYAFRPDKQGEEPFGTNDRILFSCPKNKRQSNELKLYSEIQDMFSTLISISMMKVVLI